MPGTFEITFPGASSDTANQYAANLRQVLRETDRHLAAEQVKDRPDTQDFGATLVLTLGTASITSVANGVAWWLIRNSGARIRVSQNGAIIADNLSSSDAARIAEAFRPVK